MPARRLRAILQAGFTGDNLRQLAHEAPFATSQHPGPLLVLAYVAGALAQRWEGPVPTDEAAALEERFKAPLFGLIEALDGEARQCWDAANSLAVLLTAEEVMPKREGPLPSYAKPPNEDE